MEIASKNANRQTTAMTIANEQKPTIIRTELGLTISDIRITIYDVMDYVTQQYPPHFIRALFNLKHSSNRCSIVLY